MEHLEFVLWMLGYIAICEWAYIKHKTLNSYYEMGTGAAICVLGTWAFVGYLLY